MNPPSCKTCKYSLWFADIYCTRTIKVILYDVVMGREVLSNPIPCDEERNSFTWFGLKDLCGKQGKYWETK